MHTRLERRKQLGNFRQLATRSDLIDFASNDYLGLSRSLSFQKAYQAETENHGPFLMGSGGSRLLTGNTSYAEELEKKIAFFHGFDSGLLFGCGYLANLGLISALGTEDDLFIYDAQVHASMGDGFRLTRCNKKAFRHHDLENLQKILKDSSGYKRRYVCVESIDSIDGSIFPLIELVDLCERYDARLIVDEAHSCGVLGNKGEGLVAFHQLTNRVFATVVTFGKAFGSYGAIVLGSSYLRDYLVNFARSFIFSTAPPLLQLIAIKCSYDQIKLLQKERASLLKLSLQITQRHSPIFSLELGSVGLAKDCSQFLKQNGMDVRALLSPTVKKGKECLRVSLHSYNTFHQVKNLKELVDLYKERYK